MSLRTVTKSVAEKRSLLWLLVGCAAYATVHGALMHAAIFQTAGILWPLTGVAASTAIVWVMLSIPSALVAQRISSHGRMTAAVMAVYLAGAAVVSLAGSIWSHIASRVFLNTPVHPSFTQAFVNQLDLNLFVYLMVVGGVMAGERSRQIIESAQTIVYAQRDIAIVRLRVLAMQLQPHFLFNTLHSIAELVHRDAIAAQSMVRRLSDLLRESLDQAALDAVPLDRELRSLDSYVAIQKMRFGNQLTVDVDVSPDLMKAHVPPLLLQPLVENSIRHGRGSDNGQLHILVRADRDGDRLRLEVDDNGLGPPRAWREGHGLTNTRLRLHHFYSDGARLTLNRSEEGGALATIEVPFSTTTHALPQDPPLEPADVVADRSQTRRSLLIVVTIFALWTTWALVWVFQMVMNAKLADHSVLPPVRWMLRTYLFNAWAWAGLTFAVAWIARKWPVMRARFVVPLLIHGGAVATIIVLLMILRWRLALGMPNTPLLSQGRVNWANWDLLAFTMIVVFTTLIERAKEHRLTELKATRLAAQLTLARIDVLKWQLRPNFLTETLNDIGRFSTTDADRSDELTTRLGDLMRLVLQQVGANHSSVATETEAVEAYIDILGLRAAGRIERRITIDPGAHASMIPTMLLLRLLDQVISDDLVKVERATVTLAVSSDENRITISVSAESLPPVVLDRNPAELRARLDAVFGSSYRLSVDTADARNRLRLDLPVVK